MSFGASPTDIIAVVTLCKSLYRECRAAGGEYDEISHEVRSLHTVLRHLKYEAEAPKSPLNRDRAIWTHQLAPTIAGCDSTLKQLSALVLKYGSKRGASSSGKHKVGSNEMDQLGAIRVKVISLKRALTAFLDLIQLPPSTMASNLDNTDGQLDALLDKVDAIAARLGQRHEDGNREAWKQFRRELIAEGFSSDVLQQNEDVLRAYIREMDQEGLLDNPPSEDIIPPHPNSPPANRQIELPKPPPPEANPAFFPLQVQRDDAGTKEMLAREDNMKFPPSMKSERRKPESRTEGVVQTRTEMTQISKASSPDIKNRYYISTDGTSDDEEDSDCSLGRPKSPSDGEVINTIELIALSQALTIRPPGAPGSFNAGSFVDNHGWQSMAHRPKALENKAPPSHPGSMPIPVPNSQQNLHLSTSPLPNAPLQDRLSTSPRPGTTPLAPDDKGNPIKPEALWTKIDRRLVSPEVLAQDGRRYEARPEFVAVLGVLSRSEIQSLAARSAALRSARHPHPDHSHAHHPPYHPHHHHPPPHSQPQSPQFSRPPTFPPTFPRSIPTPRHSTSDSDPGHTSSESEHPRQPHHKDAKPPRSILKNASVPNYTHSQTPHSPIQSPGWASEGRSRNDFGRSSRDGFYHSDEYDRDYDREYDREHRERERDRERAREREEREREREREARKKERREREREREREKEKDKERDKDKDRDKKKGFKIGHREVTAAGIGGAAMSLLTVLSEAAQGI